MFCKIIDFFLLLISILGASRSVKGNKTIEWCYKYRLPHFFFFNSFQVTAERTRNLHAGQNFIVLRLTIKTTNKQSKWECVKHRTKFQVGEGIFYIQHIPFQVGLQNTSFVADYSKIFSCPNLLFYRPCHSQKSTHD